MTRARLAVLLLAFAAATLAPRAMLAVSEAKGRRLAWELEGLRSAIEMYRVQHGGRPPGYVVEGGEYRPAPDLVVMQLTGYTDVCGHVSSVPDRRRYPFGPYMGRIPASPFGGEAGPRSVRVIGPGEPVPPAGDGGTAWLYRIETGSIRANTNAVAPDGSRYYDW